MRNVADRPRNVDRAGEFLLCSSFFECGLSLLDIGYPDCEHLETNIFLSRIYFFYEEGSSSK